MTLRSSLFALFGIGLLLTPACHNKNDPDTADAVDDGSAEEAGEEVDEAAEDAAEAVDDAADDTEDAADEVADEADDAAD